MAVLSITFPIFAIIALGFACFRLRVFGPEALPAFGGFVLNIAFPALIFETLSTQAHGLDAGYALASAAGGLATLFAGLTLVRLLGQTRQRSAVMALGMCMPNSAFVGFPILMLAFPDVARQALAMNMMVENLLLLPIALTVIELSAATGAGPFRAIGKALLSLLRRPLILALLAGAAVAALGLPVPEALLRITGILGRGGAPLALFFIGGTLAGLSWHGARIAAVEIAAGKLLLHPAMVALAILAVPLLGLPAVAPDFRPALMVSAAVPMITIFGVLVAERGEQGLASLATLIGTLASFFTLTLLLSLV